MKKIFNKINILHTASCLKECNFAFNTQGGLVQVLYLLDGIYAKYSMCSVIKISFF